MAARQPPPVAYSGFPISPWLGFGRLWFVDGSRCNARFADPRETVHLFIHVGWP